MVRHSHRGYAVPVRGSSAPATVLLVCSTRERPRHLLTRAFPRGRAQVHVVRAPEEIEGALRSMLVDAIIVDLLPATLATVGVRAVEHATRHAPIPAVGLVSPRTLDAALVTQLYAAGMATVLVDGVDDALVRALLHPVLLTTRFTTRADVLLAAHHVGPLAETVWRTGVSHTGRLTSVAGVARQLGLSREHLSRSLAAAGSPGPKQLLDLVRLLVVQTQLAAGVPVARAAARLGYSSVSHLARAARLATGLTPGHWGGLSAEALIERAVRRAREVPVSVSGDGSELSD